MKKSNSKVKKEILQYILNDYQFLQDYQIVETHKSIKNTFIAQIKNSTQKVRFIKRKFNEQCFSRFKALCKLYKNGIVLADNMFIIEECEELYFYIIEAELQTHNNRFKSLHQFMYQNKPSEEERKTIISKIKILVDCLHEQGQPFAGLDTRNIIIDDENHLYFAPFQLQYQLKTDNFSRSYYPPQVLAKISEESSQIDEINLMKWDYWSFGCIVAEVLLYNSPLFLSTSLAKQLKKINQLKIIEQLSNLQEPLKNIVVNSLQKDPILRNISTNKGTIEIEENMKKTLKTVKKISEQSNEDQMTELNLYKENETGDSQLVINLLTLQNFDFKDELHLVICLNKKYHFYIDHGKDANKYKLNKKITIRADFNQISKILENSILVEAKSGGKTTPILLNLQTLVMMYGGKRLWNKKLLGTYKPDKNSHNLQAKLKVSCTLNSPQIYVEEYLQKDQTMLKIPSESTLAPKEIDLSSTAPKILIDTTNIPKQVKKKSRKSEYHHEIPSISQISNNITNITQQFMQKFSSNQQSATNDDSFKQKIEKMLESS